MNIGPWEWIAIGIVALIALAGQVLTLVSIERDRERDEHGKGLPL